METPVFVFALLLVLVPTALTRPRARDAFSNDRAAIGLECLPRTPLSRASSVFPFRSDSAHVGDYQLELRLPTQREVATFFRYATENGYSGKFAANTRIDLPLCCGATV